MADMLRGLRVFIASPGGLDDVRQCFHKVITAYNEADAVRRGTIFLPIAWKDAFGGRGNAQAHINRELQTCDYFVMILHDRWGSPTGSLNRQGEPYRSGTEEEYTLAKELHDAGSMSDMLVFFRAVERGQRADPGEQLSQVLAFRRQLEDDHSIAYLTFEEVDQFADELRRHLAKWLRDSERQGDEGDVAKAAPPPPPVPQAGGTALDHAVALVGAKRFTEAETLLAGLTTDGNAVAAVTYAELLAGLSQLHQAEAMFGQAIALSERQGAPDVHARALVGLAKIHEGRRRFTDAAKALRSAIMIFERLDDVEGSADALIRSAELYKGHDDERAGAAYADALRVIGERQLPALAARAHSGIGELLRDEGRWEEAQATLTTALSLKQAAGDDDLADLLASLGGALEGAGDFVAAEAKYRQSLAGFERTGNDNGIADAADHLGQVCVAQSKLGDAEDAFERSALTFESLQLIDAAADAYVSLARVQEQRGDFNGAENSLRAALALTDRRKEANLEAARDEIYKGLETVYAKQQAA